MHESYLSQIRRKTLGRLVAFTRMIGSSSNERIIMDSGLIMKYHINNKRKRLRKQCKTIVCKAVIQIVKLHDLINKCELYIKHSKYSLFINISRILLI